MLTLVTHLDLLKVPFVVVLSIVTLLSLIHHHFLKSFPLLIITHLHIVFHQHDHQNYTSHTLKEMVWIELILLHQFLHLDHNEILWDFLVQLLDLVKIIHTRMLIQKRHPTILTWSLLIKNGSTNNFITNQRSSLYNILTLCFSFLNRFKIWPHINYK